MNGPVRAAAWFGLAVCALMTLAFISSELLPVGLLTAIAPSLHATLPQTGALLTIYAFVVTIAGPPLTALTGAVPRKPLLLGLIATLAVTGGTAALAQTYAELFAARVVNALAHGVFWAIIPAAAASLVPAAKRGTAVAIAYGGSSLGIVAGVPLVTLAGERFGWHAAFWCIAALASAGFVALAASPAMPPALGSSLADVRDLLRDVRFRRLITVTTVAICGYFTAFTYFAPLLARDGSRTAGAIPALLFAYGIAGLASNFAFGPLAQHRARTAVLLAASLMLLALAALAVDRNGSFLSPPELVAVVALWGIGSSGLVVAFQTRVLAAQPARPDVASALNSSAFNIGIGSGAFVGGLVLRRFGLDPLPVVAAALIGLAIVVELLPTRAPDAPPKIAR